MDGVLRGAVICRRRAVEVGLPGEWGREQVGSMLPVRKGATFACLMACQRRVVRSACLEPLSSSAFRAWPLPRSGRGHGFIPGSVYLNLPRTRLPAHPASQVGRQFSRPRLS